MNECIIKEIEFHEYDNWDNFVDESPYGSIFNKTIWLSKISSLLKKKFKIFGCYKNNNLIGGLSAYFPEKNTIAPPPITPFNSILISQPKSSKPHSTQEYEKDVYKAFIDFFKRFESVDLVHSTTTNKDIRLFLWNKWIIIPRYTYLIYLNDKEKVWNNINKSTRKRISGAKSEGIEFIEDGDVKDVFSVYSMTFERKHMKVPIKKEIFLEFFEYLRKKNLCKVFLTKNNGIFTSGRIIVIDGYNVFDIIAGTNPDYFSTNDSRFIVWKIFESLCEKHKTFDFVGADIESVELFKSYFGGHITLHFQTIKNNSLMSKIRYNLFHLLR